MAETRIKTQQAVTGDGWSPADETWTYASASTITIPSGGASRYQKGDKIKFTQTTVKYGVIVAVADTLLTIAVNTDYTVANAAISAIYVSREASPFGYPTWFNFSPAVTWVGGTLPTNPSGTKAMFAIQGTMLTFSVYIGYTAGTNNTSVSMTLPVGASGSYWAGSGTVSSAAAVLKRCYMSTSTYFMELETVNANTFLAHGSYGI